MQRENRYVVLKNKDIENYLTDAEHNQLDDLCRKINRSRLLDEKEIVQCVVVEHDWPEYKTTWSAIESRVRQMECDHEWKWHQAAGEGRICEKCGLRDYNDD